MQAGLPAHERCSSPLELQRAESCTPSKAELQTPTRPAAVSAESAVSTDVPPSPSLTSPSPVPAASHAAAGGASAHAAVRSASFHAAASEHEVADRSGTKKTLQKGKTASAFIDTWQRLFGERKNDKHQHSALVFRDFIEEELGGPLRAWFKVLDRNRNGRVDKGEFQTGMEHLKYPSSIESLFDELDVNQTGELLLEDLSLQSSRDWDDFRQWCANTFQGPMDMIQAIRRNGKSEMSSQGGSRMNSYGGISEKEFIVGLPRLGWTGGREHYFYGALDVDDEGSIGSRSLKWLEAAIQRNKMKEACKKALLGKNQTIMQARYLCNKSLEDFKKFLKQRFGTIYQGWRLAFDSDGNMTVPKIAFFKACREMKWDGNVRAVWKALDKDMSNVSAIEELDPKCAQQLARFKHWAETTYGMKPLRILWRLLDPHGNDKVPYTSFVNFCRANGFDSSAYGQVWIDTRRQKYLVQDDFMFLDHWRHPTWLLAEPDEQALEELKKAMCAKYKTSLKAWKSILDVDSSNMCSWGEFLEAMKHIGFSGNVAGAWLALDSDMSGCIGFNEIDPVAFSSLMDFKAWAEHEFGSVRHAFKSMDGNNSGELDWREFRSSTRLNGFQGDSWKLFKALDQSNERVRRLQWKELVFLDDWQFPVDGPYGMNDGVACPEDAMVPFSGMTSAQNEAMPLGRGGRQADTKRMVPSPGPGAYEILSTFCNLPNMPIAKHCGAFSFARRSKRRENQWFAGELSAVGPADFQPNENRTRKRHPAYSFGSAKRASSERGPTEAEKRAAPLRPRAVLTPGPGQYEVQSVFQTPRLCLCPMGRR